ncbi:Putative zinc-finger [Acididesulfobacillus acetoxydans]|uniref:Anti-sigma-W factor RsiW n=1 Tax=Acididesulfobacillus acetoxydans TaxID=1561005 RepID=A0A8S0VWX3_9FIRM|nr:zf-HC2 domain-containing protein [Acididesulfobacillus acetoxydans]CAA7601333.1 Putative zinc-finger [Acididesulfobacillus acetoxydans]CEJ09365.1 Putative zinc-finger [Acididesulfobacillus acetoxydans]
MDCKLDKVLLQDLLEGTIDPVEKLFVEEHLKTCRECRQELTELKLLFWDLFDKSNYEVSLPSELDQIKDLILANAAEQPAKSTAEIICDIQRQNIRASGMFLDYVPGLKTGNMLVKESVKAAPSAMLRISKGLVKATKFFLAK